MPRRLTPCSPDRLIKALKSAGWREDRQSGSHKIFERNQGDSLVVVPYHRGRDIPAGTLANILKQAGLTPDDL